MGKVWVDRGNSPASLAEIDLGRGERQSPASASLNLDQPAGGSGVGRTSCERVPELSNDVAGWTADTMYQCSPNTLLDFARRRERIVGQRPLGKERQQAERLIGEHQCDAIELHLSRGPADDQSGIDRLCRIETAEIERKWSFALGAN